ncbi:DUF2164 domain-containing protein [Priestia flexa]|uniref:DUF2164 domain-containing protein n=1 Tax=Priestia flexa TaxID=86664 RepID=A0ABU4JAV4_9BACI|nr:MULTISPECIES: DUF2164 domain-containing protein [Bacillaceae]MCA0966885.1 DUF2164 domain-containing protein [Priestia flexa]MCA1201086.1 DUF2164 domain-containing protein [Priestia flexa]MCG7312588.1 DUF2164 domain-containing protein [Priestia flexa]MCM3067044.1 DUF2164 domain-containing protein [Priestia flexa]MCP1189198.1 DUF2164 domain-containing protein [Priestia flexa]
MTISKEKKKVLIEEIQTYFLNERDEEIGELAAGLLLDFFIDKIAVEFYNLGVEDSYRYMSDRLEDLFAIQK